MPVPVPRHSRPVAHPVLKNINCVQGRTNKFQNLASTLPLSPTGPPPSFSTREEWINSLPSWRRTKPRRIWEDNTRSVNEFVEQGFRQGLTVAGNASVIKGEHAEACIPPHYTLFRTGQPPANMTPDIPLGLDRTDDAMSTDYLATDQTHLTDRSQWIADSLAGNNDNTMMECGFHTHVTGLFNAIPDITCNNRDYERGAFTPVFEDQSPGIVSGQERPSSPLEPVTPFGAFVDQVIGYPQPCIDGIDSFDNTQDYGYQEKNCDLQCHPLQSLPNHAMERQRESTPAPVPEVVTPNATHVYKRLAEPLSDWVANYVWKVCTTGLSLPTVFARNDPSVLYSDMPPSYLAVSIHSLLLSTLLQPSAVFLAIWYIVRLPVCFTAVALGPEHVKEARFRAALFGDSHTSFDKGAMEASAPFRLIVLGCMLANKWLDDHTFSNKTWHNISNVPIQALNKLESLTLDIFAYDLSVPSHDWSQWLVHVMSYHLALASPTRPQPISRPSTNPHSIVRKAIEEIIQAPAACMVSPTPQPVFLGLEERKREKAEKEKSVSTDVLEIDLDEDGPLRQEYLPKRRTGGVPASYGTHPTVVSSGTGSGVEEYQWKRFSAQEVGKRLPPPAKWSPAGDEPLHRDKNRVGGQYVAVQPPIIHGIRSLSGPYHQVDVGYHQWNSGGTYTLIGSQPAYIFNLPIDPSNSTTYNVYPYTQIAISHSRSQSLSHDQENMPNRNHMPSHSQSGFGYRHNNSQPIANEYVPCSQADIPWMSTRASHYSYPGSTFAPIHNVNYQPTWLRT